MVDAKVETRQERGLAIAAKSPVKRNQLGWSVPSQSGKGAYVVNMDGDNPFCTCPDFETRQQSCKHIYAVEFVIEREDNGDGTSTYRQTARVTYRQQWTAYNKAQTNERDQFVRLLKELCEGIPQPPQGKGRPRLPLGDVVFSLVGKVYSTMSGRRFTSDLRDAQAKGLIDKAPHYNSSFRYLDKPELTPLLKSLIEQSAQPLSVIESDFAIDSTGFTSSVYDRWFDHKWGKMRKEARWAKAHLMTGVKTNIVTSVEVTPTESADAPFLTQLVNTTAKGFNINEVSADKAYSSRKNLHAVEAVDATPYIPFKARTNGIGKSYDGLWHRMWSYYQFNRGEFLSHYHKRSNAETTISMIKAKFGTRIRSKSPVAQVNEVLCKVLAHNICVLIQSVYELGLEPVFWSDEPSPKSEASAPIIGGQWKF